MGKLLSQQQIQQYLRDGIVFPLDVLSAETAARYRQHCDQLEATLGGNPHSVEVRQMHLHLPWAWQLVTEPQVVDAVQDVLGPEILVWATELFTKHPGSPSISIGWHRDQPYMGFDPATVTTAWIALSDSTAENGCMCVRIEPDPTLSKAAQPSADDHTSRPPDRSPAQTDITCVELKAGQMSLHDPLVLHGSGANRSDQKRVGLVVRYISPDAQPLAGRPPIVRVRGSRRVDQFTLVEPPQDDVDNQQAICRMKESAARHLDAILENLKLAKAR